MVDDQKFFSKHLYVKEKPSCHLSLLLAYNTFLSTKNCFIRCLHSPVGFCKCQQPKRVFLHFHRSVIVVNTNKLVCGIQSLDHRLRNNFNPTYVSYQNESYAVGIQFNMLKVCLQAGSSQRLVVAFGNK